MGLVFFLHGRGFEVKFPICVEKPSFCVEIV